MSQESKVERAARWARNHAVIAILIVVGVVVVWMAEVTGAAEELLDRVTRVTQPPVEVLRVDVLTDRSAIKNYFDRWFPEQPPVYTDTIKISPGFEDRLDDHRPLDDDIVFRPLRDSTVIVGTKKRDVFPVIDIIVRNRDDIVHVVTGLNVHARQRKRPEDWDCDYFGPSALYNIRLQADRDTQTAKYTVSQAVEPNGVDRFGLIIGHDAVASAEYTIEAELIYDEEHTTSLGVFKIPMPFFCASGPKLDSIYRGDVRE